MQTSVLIVLTYLFVHRHSTLPLQDFHGSYNMEDEIEIIKLVDKYRAKMSKDRAKALASKKKNFNEEDYRVPTINWYPINQSHIPAPEKRDSSMIIVNEGTKEWDELGLGDLVHKMEEKENQWLPKKLKRNKERDTYQLHTGLCSGQSTQRLKDYFSVAMPSMHTKYKDIQPLNEEYQHIAEIAKRLDIPVTRDDHTRSTLHQLFAGNPMYFPLGGNAFDSYTFAELYENGKVKFHGDQHNGRIQTHILTISR